MQQLINIAVQSQQLQQTGISIPIPIEQFAKKINTLRDVDSDNYTLKTSNDKNRQRVADMIQSVQEMPAGEATPT